MTISDVRRVALLVLALLTLVAWAPSAAAETDEQRAVALFEKGRKLAREGRCGDAIPVLLESIKYAEGVGALLNLGNCYESLVKTASAQRAFLRARDLAASKKDARSDEAAARARALEPEVPTLAIHVATRAAEGRETLVRVDGEEWARERWGRPVPIDPGAHAVEIWARAGDQAPKETRPITVARGEHAEIELSAPPPGEREKPAPPRPTEPAIREPGSEAKRGSESTSGGGQRTLSYVVGGVGAAGLVVGAIFGVLSLTTHASIVGRCPTYPRCSTTDQTTLAPLNDRAAAEGTVSTVALVAGGALLAGGLALFLTAPGR
jgi:hypothetical protein